MDILNKNFESAVENVNNLKKKPTNEELLVLYGLFKQSKVGNNNTNKPNFLNFKESKKWEAWNKNNGKDQGLAKQEYINIANDICNKYN